MKLGERIKEIRAAKKLSQKDVTMVIDMEPAQYSRIENDKNDPSVSTLEKIAKALGISLSEFFNEEIPPTEVYSGDKTIMEKVKLMESLEEGERRTIFSILDAFVSKKKLREALEGALKIA